MFISGKVSYACSPYKHKSKCRQVHLFCSLFAGQYYDIRITKTLRSPEALEVLLIFRDDYKYLSCVPGVD